MKKTLAILVVLGLFLVLGATACSALPAPIRQDLATAIAAPTITPAPAPSVAATPQAKRSTTPNPNANPLAALKRFGLEGGVVASNEANTLMLRIGKASEQLTIAPTTLIVVPGQANAKLSDIQVGDRAIAKIPDGNANSSPELVLDFPRSYTAANIAMGVVQARSSANSFTVRTRGGSKTIAPGAGLVVIDMTGSQPVMGQLTDLKRGSGMLAIGNASGDTLNAQVLVLLDVTKLGGNGNNSATPTPTP